MRSRTALVVAGTLLVLGGCGDDVDDVGSKGSSTTRAETAGQGSGSAATEDLDPTAPAPAAPTPGRIVIEAGGERFDFALKDCLVGVEQTRSEYSRLVLTGSRTEPYEEADVFVSVSILVSPRLSGHEEHVLSITDLDGPSLGAADLNVPSRGGPAPDDWIEIGDGVVTGSGFELWELAPDGARYVDGTLVADCPAAAGS